MRATVETVDVDQRTLNIRTADNERIVIPADYLDAGHVAYGYAATIHKTQSKTMDRTLVLGSDELFRAHGYVAMSRGRDSNHLYVVGGPELDRSTDHVPAPEQPEPFELVRQALHREQPKRLAIDSGDAFALWSVERLVDERDRLQTIFDACPEDRTVDLRSLRARRERLQRELDPDVERYNGLADKRFRGPKTRAEMVSLKSEISQRTASLRQTEAELVTVEKAMDSRADYIEGCQPYVSRWETLNDAIEDRLARYRTDRVAIPAGPQIESPSDDQPAVDLWDQGLGL